MEVPDASAGVRMARGGPGPTCGGPAPRPQVLSISTSGTRGDTGPVPEQEAGPGRWSGEMESEPRSPAAQLLRA